MITFFKGLEMSIVKQLKEKTSLDLKVSFQEAFTFPNGQQVTNITELIDVLPSVGGPEFEKVINKDKNDTCDSEHNT